MNKLLAVVLASLLLAPFPWGIALNHERRECGGYWRGDEYGTASLPEGWTDYYPDGQGIVHTEVGDCDFGSGPGGNAERCCQELGYTYVGPQVGKARVSPLLLLGGATLLCGGLLIVGAVALVVLLAAWLVRRARRRRQQNTSQEAG